MANRSPPPAWAGTPPCASWRTWPRPCARAAAPASRPVPPRTSAKGRAGGRGTRTRPPHSDAMGRVRIGCSGWTYKDWTGPFYPPGAKDRERLEYYATRFDTTEINASFYRLPSEAMVEGWARRAPPGFTFAWKVSRFITHNKKLRDC